MIAPELLAIPIVNSQIASIRAFESPFATQWNQAKDFRGIILGDAMRSTMALTHPTIPRLQAQKARHLPRPTRPDLLRLVHRKNGPRSAAKSKPDRHLTTHRHSREGRFGIVNCELKNDESPAEVE